MEISSSSDLYDVIGNTYGGKESKFRLPDYRGYFLKGSNNKNVGAKIDKSSASTPNSSFLCSIPHLPKSSYRISGECYHGGSRDAGDLVGTISGGDDETRPLNAAVYYYIKCK